MRLPNVAGFKIGYFLRAFSVVSVTLLVFLLLMRASVRQIASSSFILALYLSNSRKDISEM